MKLDYFFYSCFEFEQTCKAFPAKALGPQRWPEILNFLDGQRADFREFGGFKDQIRTALSWYCEQFPTLVQDKKLEMENIYGIASATAYFGLDLRILASNDEANTKEILASSDSNALWSDIDAIVDQKVPHLAHFVKAYLRWLYIKKEEQVWETGSRPPVGRFAPGAARRMASSGRAFGDARPPLRKSGGPGGRSGGGGDRGGRDRDRGGGGDRGGRDRDRDRDRGPRKGPPSAARSGGGGGSHAEQERAALDAVHDAVEKLRRETNVQEIRLDPSNSFFRRLQHKKAVSEGFFSFSTGEGLTRAVVVTREKPENEDQA